MYTLLSSSLSFLEDIHLPSIECAGSINMARGRSNSWRIMCLLIMVSFHSMVNLSYQSDTILPGESITSRGGVYPNGQTITSRGGVFELGFFSPGNTGNTFVGMWYKGIPITVVWTANRDAPILPADVNDANLILTREGDLQLQVNGRIIWNTNTTTATDLNTTKAILLDSGNFIIGSDSSPNMWESFNYPTYAWFPGAKLGLDATNGKTDPIILTTWRALNDYGLGNYSLGVDLNGSSELLIWNKRANTAMRVGASDFTDMNLESNLNITFNVSRTNGVNYATYHTLNDSDDIVVMILDPLGQLRLYIWNRQSALWLNIWTRPNVCDSYAPCGGNGICSMNQSLACSCPNGFQPNYTSDSELHDYFAGCARRNGSQCLKDKDEFISLSNIKMPQNYQSLSIGSAEVCRSACADNCSCSAYSNTAGCYMWYGDLRGMEQLYNTTAGETIFLRSGLGELPRKGKKSNTTKTVILIAVLVTIVVVLFIGIIAFIKIKKKRKRKLFSNADPNDEISEEHLQYDLTTIKLATDDFSDDKKLGQGGFGAVYMGKLSNGQEIAVKRMSVNSSQGDLEFKNEVMLLAKLHHRNLVRLLGYCLEGPERLLIYELVVNSSLDHFIFDHNNHQQLDWEMHYKIIIGIARGLLYLHEDSPLRIIHRDLKASNILLDANMSPKISDFGMAKLFAIDQTQADTSRIVGTYGYMAPEYAMHGNFSVKSDVFSFGVLLLEIVSGQRNNSFPQGENIGNLLTYVWRNWREGLLERIIDPTLRYGSVAEITRCIHVGLLCVQENVANRPTMASVLLMLSSNSTTLALPSQPAFFLENNIESDVTSTQERNSEESKGASRNNASFTELYPR